MLATTDAAQPFFESPMLALEGDRRKDRFASAQLLRAFGRGFQRENFCSSVSVCFANKRVQLRRRASAVDALVCKLRGIAKVLRDSGDMKRGSSICDDKIARGGRRFCLFAPQNCADQLRVRLWADRAGSLHALLFQSKIVR